MQFPDKFKQDFDSKFDQMMGVLGLIVYWICCSPLYAFYFFAGIIDALINLNKSLRDKLFLKRINMTKEEFDTFINYVHARNLEIECEKDDEWSFNQLGKKINEISWKSHNELTQEQFFYMMVFIFFNSEAEPKDFTLKDQVAVRSIMKATMNYENVMKDLTEYSNRFAIGKYYHRREF